jgi:hypothetical protein
MDSDEQWGLCDICTGEPAFSVHWSLAWSDSTTRASVPSMWRFCKRCHRSILARDWPTFLVRAMKAGREVLLQDHEPGIIHHLFYAVAFAASRTGQWIARDGSTGSIKPPEEPKRWPDAETWRREGP